jgi:DNA-binding NarL/FixJ family response regulator
MTSLSKVTVPPRRVLVVEDEGLIRAMLKDMLTAAGFDVIAVAGASTAVQEFPRFDPDAILCDIDLGSGVSGLDLIVSLTKEAPYLGVVILSNYEITSDYRKRWFERALYLRKSDVNDAAVVLQALETVLSDSHDKNSAAGAESTSNGLSSLTPTQVQVLRMVAMGLSNAEIAERRGSTVGAVEHILNRIFVALGLETDPAVNMRVTAARMFIEWAGRPGTAEPTSR